MQGQMTESVDPISDTPPETQKSKGRIEWIDVAKGIAMFLVIYEHATYADYPPLNHVFVSFVMPMFFLLAGLTYNNTKYRVNLRGFLSSRGRQFMIPYVILMSLWIVMAVFIPGSASQNPGELVFWFLYGAGPPTGSPHLWFLPMMFIAMVIFVSVDKAMERFPANAKWIFLAIFPLIALYLNTAFANFLIVNWPFTTGLVPWRMGGVFVAATFMLMGNEIRRFMKLRDWTIGSTSLDVGAIIGMSLILLALSEFNGYTDIASDVIGTIWIYLATGIIGTYVMFASSSLLANYTTQFKNFLMRVGNASQEIYELHPMTMRIVFPILSIFGVTATQWWLNPEWWIVNSFFICVFTIPLVFYVISKNKYLRFVFKGSMKEYS